MIFLETYCVLFCFSVVVVFPLSSSEAVHASLLDVGDLDEISRSVRKNNS